MTTEDDEAERLRIIAERDAGESRAQYERDLAREKAKATGTDLEAFIVSPKAKEPESIEDVSARVLELVRRQSKARMSLPCSLAMYPDGQEPRNDGERADDLVGKQACEVARAFESCSVKGTPLCPRSRVLDLRDEVAGRLSKARVPREEAALILNALASRDPVPLRPLDTLRIARAVVQHRRQTIALENGAEVTAEGQVSGRALLTGRERIVVLGGNRGRGKTVAAQYLLARVGGLYLTEPAFGRIQKDGGVDIREAKAARVLVIDQLGRASRGGSDFAPAAIEEVVDARCADGLLTVLAGNFTADEFKQRYGAIIMDRIAGFGVFVLFGGESIRPGLRS